MARAWHHSRLSTLFVLLLAAVGCAGPDRILTSSEPVPRCCAGEPGKAREENSSWRQSVVRTAVDLLGAHTIEIDGRRIAYDCAGVTRAIFLSHGVDLYRSTFVSRQANGVRLIYQHVKQFGRLHDGSMVRPADLVFFHNTWDANGDGRVNDPLTHVGLVETVDGDGTIVFISRVAGAVERYRMNLASPHVHRHGNGEVLNDYLRRKDRRDDPATRYLTAELLAGFGSLERP